MSRRARCDEGRSARSETTIVTPELMLGDSVRRWVDAVAERQQLLSAIGYKL